MNTRLDTGNVMGSRPAASKACFRIGTEALNSAMLDPPEPIQPSASAAARRTASGWPAPIHKGGGGLAPGRGGRLTILNLENLPREGALFPGPNRLDRTNPPPRPP